MSEEDGKEKIIREYHNYMSTVLNHDTQYICECLLELLAIPMFSSFNNLHFWMDVSPHHFHTHEMTHTMISLSALYDHVSWNYFVEYHGKNICDSHFALLSKFLSAYEQRSVVPLSSLDDLLRMFKAEIERVNREREELYDHEPLLVSFNCYERRFQPTYKPQVVAPRFKYHIHFSIYCDSPIVLYKRIPECK